MGELLNRWEQPGLARGFERGRIEGTIEAILHVLSYKGITVDVVTKERIHSLDRERLLDLAGDLLDWQQRSDLDAWLASNAPQE